MEKITKRQQLLYRFYKEKKIYKNYKHLRRNNYGDFQKNYGQGEKDAQWRR